MGKIVIVFSKLFGGDAVLLNIYFVILLLSSSEQGEGYERGRRSDTQFLYSLSKLV